MRVIGDLAIGQAPSPREVFYNGAVTDSTTTRYKGSLVKFMDVTDVDHGTFFTFAGATTAMENVAGILEEETSADYTLDNATYPATRRKMTPIFGTSIVRAEYARKDAAGTDNYDTSATATKASTTFTVTIGTADLDIGGWVYFLNGDNANYLHYVINNSTSTATFSTTVANAVVSADDWLFINPPHDRFFLFDATYTGLKSEVSDTARSSGDFAVFGLEYWVTAPGMPMSRLDRGTHDGIYLPNARFYHDILFVGVGNAAGGPSNLFVSGPTIS